MRLEYDGQEQIPASPDVVWSFIVDPERIATCLPDVLSFTVNDASHVDAIVRVGVGPVRGNFKFKIALQPEPEARRMAVAISGGGLGSAVDLSADAVVRDGGEGATLLDWRGAATMRGPVASVGGRVLDAQARKMIGQTFANVKSGVMSMASRP